MGRALYSILEWITRFAYLNGLWIFFTITGGIVLGLFPATVVMFSVMRQWLKGKSDQPVFPAFWRLYKQEFWKSNRLGLIIYLISFIFIFNLFFLQANIGELLLWTSAPLLGGMLFFVLILFYLFPTYAHFDLPVFQLFRHAFLTMLVSPLHTLCIILGLGGFYLLATVIPALAVVFGASFYSFITMWVSLDAFHRIHKKNA